MKKLLSIFTISAFAFAFSASLALAAPPEKTDAFVCPVLTQEAIGEHNPQAVGIGEDHYTIIGPDVNVPIHATNGDGNGTPPGPHSEPGDTDYTAIWAG